ncbi:hypothetical protein GDO86_003283 [Hymenochirus boettgeri]|uniref:Uncharacterized protein n=1 Tax=Hymenochirus boettgeri TaxID=247094 RepID=A0A8T2K8N4_9PIPI|nr:hypothetical protein GDO86_003283 [Hymenochirus boettgeri]
MWYITSLRSTCSPRHLSGLHCTMKRPHMACVMGTHVVQVQNHSGPMTMNIYGFTLVLCRPPSFFSSTCLAWALHMHNSSGSV